MALFNEDGLKKKLNDLNMSQQSIQTLSLWLIHHKKHAHTVVNVWMRELMKVSDARKLVFMYLANDVIQNSKKKGPEYSKEFLKRLPKVFEHLGAIRLDGKSKQGVERLLAVWEERGVFNESAIQSFKKGYEGLKNISIKASKTEQPPAKRPRRSSSLGAASDEDMESGVDSEDGEDSNAAATAATATPAGAVVNLSPPSPSSAPPLKSPPDPELLISSLQSLESAATADAATREQIAKMPTAVSDSSSLAKLKDATEGRELLKVVDEALKLLLEYNGRLAKEMESRKALAKLLHDSIRHQKEKIVHTEEMLEEYRVKLAKVLKIKAELRAHLQNLPDISRMPKVGSTLPPLPSAGDLFTV
ncbi:regulation of nuclear pre-mRNA domain-containing protein 1B [Hyalella azteca]|uniref:Regulation of nuclear pre-mRNA domain-containing protein 1B n=1 Tax=Hyalella azteca TaxID=294128 RepID=A0A8B7PD21_HYAAZ|nr:regulation of nuclear pre-mRNA domain-containing protein 1B [Hyalella azteca]